MVELQTHHHEFTAAGVDLFCLSYDEPEAIADFSTAHGVDFTLLSDPESAIIERFGILNTLIPENDHPWYGIPFPGCYVIDADGVIVQKFFDNNLAVRPSPAQLLRAARGEHVDLAPAPPSGEVTIDVELDADHLAVGVLQDLVVKFTVPEGRHLYREPVPTGLVAATVSLDDTSGLVSRAPITPPTKPLTLAGSGETLEVYDGSFEIRVPITHNGSDTTKLDDGSRAVTVSGTVRWQSCDDEACGLPQSQSFSFAVLAAMAVRPDIGSNGTAPAMNGAAHFERMTTRRQP